MKKILLSTSMLAILAGSSVAYAASTNTTQGTINFVGTITDTSCEVTTIGSNDTIDFGQIAKSALASDGSESGTKEFSIELTGCPASITAADINFSGTPAAAKDSLYAIRFNANSQESSTAGLNLQINPDNTIYQSTLNGQMVIDLSQLMTAEDGSTQSTITIPAKAAIQRIGSGTLETGTFSSTVGFTVTYQ